MNIVLFQPEIPPNTGNIIRLCANTGAQLHLIHPLGFKWDDKQLKRAGLDYHEWASIVHHQDYQAFKNNIKNSVKHNRVWAFSTKGHRYYHQGDYQAEDYLLFGPETRGLPAEVLVEIGFEHVLRLPMLATSRSLNLSNTVAIGLFEALRQQEFKGLK